MERSIRPLDGVFGGFPKLHQRGGERDYQDGRASGCTAETGRAAAAVTAFQTGTSRGQPMTEKPSATLPGTVEEIMKSPLQGEPERAKILIEEADHSYQEIRIENTLIDEKGEEVRLKPGANVQVTVGSRAVNNENAGR
jgi:hypothetical protein